MENQQYQLEAVIVVYRGTTRQKQISCEEGYGMVAAAGR